MCPAGWGRGVWVKQPRARGEGRTCLCSGTSVTWRLGRGFSAALTTPAPAALPALAPQEPPGICRVRASRRASGMGGVAGPAARIPRPQPPSLVSAPVPAAGWGGSRFLRRAAAGAQVGCGEGAAAGRARRRREAAPGDEAGAWPTRPGGRGAGAAPGGLREPGRGGGLGRGWGAWLPPRGRLGTGLQGPRLLPPVPPRCGFYRGEHL